MKSSNVHKMLDIIIQEEGEIDKHGGKYHNAEILGIIVSQYLRHDGAAIFAMAWKAFENANYHNFNEDFIELWMKSKTEGQYKL